MTPSENAVLLSIHFESCRLKAYLDSGGLPTIGYGNRHYLDGTPVKLGDEITQEYADKLHLLTLKRFSGYLDSYGFKNLNQNQYDALVDFMYNRGPGNFEKTRLFRLLRINVNDEKIKDAFLDKESIIDINKEVLNGLIRRRKSEAHLYLTGELKFYFDNDK